MAGIDYDHSTSELSEDGSLSEAEEFNEVLTVNSVIAPYQNEPLALGPQQVEGNPAGEADEEVDEDGLSIETIEARYEKVEPVAQWCRCISCNDQFLVGAREYRCCWDVQEALGKLTFEGIAEEIPCVTMHPDYKALTHHTVLQQVGPLLKDRNGRGYRCRGNESKNDYARAVGYRWIAKWLFGYMGWDNTRPLPACIYHELRTRFSTGNASGYKTSQQRE